MVWFEENLRLNYEWFVRREVIIESVERWIVGCTLRVFEWFVRC